MLLGTAVAFVLYQLTGLLRLPASLKPASIVGWHLFSITLFQICGMIALWLKSRDDPYPAMAHSGAC